MTNRFLESSEQISRQYKQNIGRVYETLTQLVHFSNTLGGRVDSLLHKQQEEFFKAYRAHLTTIKENVAQLQDKISYQEQKIKEYESEGTIALLLKKIKGLESEISNLYAVRTKQLSEFQEQKVRNNVLKTQNTKLGENVKYLMKSRVMEQMKLSETKQILKEMSLEKQEYGRIFATEVRRDGPHNSSLKDMLVKDKSSDVENKLLRSRIASLKTQNHKLLKNTVEVGTLHSELEGFFLECVETAKKEICTRKQIPSCKLNDFRRQDKIQVLNMVLQNDEIIGSIYSRLFLNPACKTTKPNQMVSVDLDQHSQQRKRKRFRSRHSEKKVMDFKKNLNLLLPSIKHKSMKAQDDPMILK